MHEWSSDGLWQKAVLYIERAFHGDRDSDLFPFFATIGLEFLARSALAHVHPSLLADPQDGANVLYAFGYAATQRPVSIPAKTIYSRLLYVVPDFTKDDQSFCLLVAERRNRELHTGDLAFRSLRNSEWLPDYYRVANRIVLSLGRQLSDLFGEQEAAEALENIKEVQSETKTVVMQSIADTKRKFSILTPSEVTARREAHAFKLRSAHYTNGTAQFAHDCPACQSVGSLLAVPIGSTAARIKNGEVASQKFFAPMRFDCKVCGLEIVGSQALRAANLSDQIVDEDTTDPVEFFGIDPMDYIDKDDLKRLIHEEEYNNE